jgi:autotransporter-associated beta strand protein
MKAPPGATIHHMTGGSRTTRRKLLLVITLTIGWMTLPSDAALKTWHGGTIVFGDPLAGTRFSVPQNWEPPGVPQNGDDLRATIGDLPGDEAIPMLNDLTNLTLRSLFFSSQASTRKDIELLGNTLGVTDTIHCGPAVDVYIRCGLRLEDLTRLSLEGFGINLYVRGDIDLNGHDLEVVLQREGAVELSGIISGTGNILINGDDTSTVGFNGAQGNTFQGSVFLRNSFPSSSPFRFHFRMNKDSGVAVPGTLISRRDTAVILNGPNQIADGAMVEFQDGATFDLNGFNETIGALRLINSVGDTNPIVIDSGGKLTVLNTIAVGNDGAPARIGNALGLGGFVSIHVGPTTTAALDLAGNISGNGFDKLGPGQLILRGLNTYSGDAAITAGTVEARSQGAFGGSGPTSGVYLNGGDLVIQSVPIPLEQLIVNSPDSTLTAIGPCSWDGLMTLHTTLKAVALDPTDSGAIFNIAGRITGSGGLNLLAPLFGVGTVRLSGSTNNSFIGPLTVSCQRLELNKPSGVNAYVGPLIVGRLGAAAPSEVRWLNSYQNVGATLTLRSNGVVNLNGFNEDFGPVTFNGGRVETGAGQFAIYQPLTVNASEFPAIVNGFLGLPPGNRAFVVADGPADCDLLVNAVMFGGATFVSKQGPGTMCLTGANTYTGVTHLEEGVLDARSGSALGSAARTIVFSNATLRLTGSGVVAEAFEIVGHGVGGTRGAIEVSGFGSFTLSGSILLAGASTINVAQNAGLAFNGVISGAGPLIKTGPGILNLGGAANNTYSGDTVVHVGTLNLTKSSSRIAVPGNLIVGPTSPTMPAIARHLQSGGVGGPAITVNANALLDLNGFNQTLTQLNLNDGGDVQTGAGRLNFNGAALVTVGSFSLLGSHVSSSITGSIGLPANDTLTFNVKAYAPSFPFDFRPELDVAAAIPRPAENVNFAPAGIQKQGPGRLRFGGANTYLGSSTVSGGTLQVDGVQAGSVVQVSSGSRLQGTGTVGRVSLSGVLAPGSSPGILTCSNLSATSGGTLQMELNGTTPGAGYDQMNVRGAVNLAGVALRTSLNFTSAVGNSFTIINNDGTDVVTGTFTGLPQNAGLYIGEELFTIRYTGGTGNDVVLTRIATPPRPVLTIDRSPPAAVRILWPTNAVGFNLQFNTNLTVTNWTAASPSPGVIGTNHVVTNATGGGQRFYRLSNP